MRHRSYEQSRVPGKRAANRTRKLRLLGVWLANRKLCLSGPWRANQKPGPRRANRKLCLPGPWLANQKPGQWLANRKLCLSGPWLANQKPGPRRANRKLRLLGLWFGGLFALVVGASGCGGDPQRPERVLLVTVDTLRPDYLSGNGYPLPTSPTLDSLMTEATVFTQALAPIPRTTQALASLLTGCYPKTTEVRTLTDAVRTGVVSIAQIAQIEGYSTIAVVSNHVLHARRRLGRGFDVYDYATDARGAPETTAAMLAHMDTLDPSKPVFAWIHYIDPHVPYYPPVELARAFDPGYEGRYRDHFGQTPGGIEDQAYPTDLPKDVAVYRNPLSEEVNEHIRKLYAADVRHTDDAIRTLLEGVHQRFGEDWLIVFTSDHGESLGEHDFYFDHGDYVYGAGLRVPLFFHFPEGHPLRAGRRVDGWVSLVDVMPTLLDLMRLETPSNYPFPYEGRSLLPAIHGERLATRPCFAECGQSFYPDLIRKRLTFDIAGRFRTVVLDNWKLIWTPGLEGPEAFELYDLARDPDETVNVYADNPEKAEPLFALLRAWADTDNTRAPEITEEDRELLRSLGYTN